MWTFRDIRGNRLNAAYSYGGAELLMETIEQNFDIHISRYVLVNFEALPIWWMQWAVWILS